MSHLSDLVTTAYSFMTNSRPVTKGHKTKSMLKYVKKLSIFYAKYTGEKEYGRRISAKVLCKGEI